MLTFDASSLDHLDILEAREDVAADAEADLDTVFDALLDVEWVLLELSELLFDCCRLIETLPPGAVADTSERL